jgi:hypothetical protein
LSCGGVGLGVSARTVLTADWPRPFAHGPEGKIDAVSNYPGTPYADDVAVRALASDSTTARSA